MSVPAWQLDEADRVEAEIARTIGYPRRGPGDAWRPVGLPAKPPFAAEMRAFAEELERRADAEEAAGRGHGGQRARCVRPGERPTMLGAGR